MPTIQAQDIVSAVIQDSQNQTTNRTALYDYTDRINQRILRESQWRFLLSDPQTFATLPGVSNYTLVNGTPVPGAFQTNLQLTDFGNIQPGSLYNLSTGLKVEEDYDDGVARTTLTRPDGSLVYGPPRTYSNSLSNPGTISLKPCPDGQNLYYPFPETPVVNAVASGSALLQRIYYGVVTYVDSLGGESTPCSIPLTISAMAGSLVTVQSPPPVPGGGIAGNQAMYTGWNLYMGFGLNAYWKQNLSQIPIGTSWTEPSTGIYQGVYSVPSGVNIGGGVFPILSIANTGQLGTQNPGFPQTQFLYSLSDVSNNLWNVTLVSGMLVTTPTVSIPGVTPLSALYLTDTSNYGTWKITVSTGGMLTSTLVATPPQTFSVGIIPPTSPTIQPINAYIMQFRYFKTRNQIVNPTDVLQVPYAYKDIVISGVNYLASQYLDTQAQREPSQKTILWKRDFDAGLAQIRRDLRVSFRKTDFITPDRASQVMATNQQGIPTMGW